MTDIEKLKQEMLSDDKIGAYFARMDFERKLQNRYIDWFKSQTVEERDRIIRCIKEKYESDAYLDRERLLGYEPRCTLLWLLDDYADIYGKHLPEDPENPFEHHNNLIDDKWVITVMYGQGAVVSISEYNEDKRTIDEMTERQEDFKTKMRKNPILRSDDSTYPNICGYSLSGFLSEDERREMRFAEDYIYKNCKHWHFFGDGLCFTCDCEEEVCPFKDIRIDNLPSEEVLKKHGREKK